MLLHGTPTQAGASNIIKQTTVLDSVGRSTYTFNSVPLGDAEPSRIIVLSMYMGITSGSIPVASNVSLVSSAVVNGTSLPTRGFFRTWVNPNGYEVDNWLGVVPTGTSVTVTITTAITMDNCEMTVYSLYNQRSATVAAASYVDLSNGTLALRENGVALFTTYGGRTVTGLGTTWSGTNSSGAYLNVTGAETARAFSVSSATAQSSEITFGALTFGP